MAVKLRPVCTLLAALLPTAALADWQVRAPQASDDNGSAFVANSAGQILDVGCGNGGSVAISVQPRPPATAQMSHPMFEFIVDGGAPMRLPVDCHANGCSQSFMLGGEIFPPAEVAALVRALGAGSSVTIRMGGNPIAQFSLAGSSAALGALRQRTACEGL